MEGVRPSELNLGVWTPAGVIRSRKYRVSPAARRPALGLGKMWRDFKYPVFKPRFAFYDRRGVKFRLVHSEGSDADNNPGCPKK
jgi:hypothetical protein